MKNKSWIKLHRKFLDSSIFTSGDSYLIQLWIYLLLSVNHKDKKMIWNGKEKLIKKGSGIFGLNQITKDLTRLKNQNTPRFKKNRIIYYRRLKTLENINCLQLHSTNKFTEISIKNWDIYQATVKPVQLQRNSSATPVLTNKNDKNVKNNTSEPSSQISRSDLVERLGIPKPNGASHEWQDMAARYAKQLGIKTNASWFKFFKQNYKSQGKILTTYQKMVDLEIKPADPEKYFYKLFWGQE